MEKVIYKYVKIRPLMDGNNSEATIYLDVEVKIRPLMDGNFLS